MTSLKHIQKEDSIPHPEVSSICVTVFIDLFIIPLANDRVVYFVPYTVLSFKDMTVNKQKKFFIPFPNRQKGR